jgi:hypothetical protein
MSSLLAQAQRFLPEGVLHQDLPSRPVQYTAIAALVLFGWVLYQVLTPPASQYPAINDDKAWFSLRAKAEYFKNAKQLLADGSKKVRRNKMYCEPFLTKDLSSRDLTTWLRTVEMS